MTRIKWTPERLKEDALKYKTRQEWKKMSSGYSAAQSRGIIDECCGHMTMHQKPKGYWTLERLKEDALKYNTRSDWQKMSGSAYDAAHKKGLLDKCCGHMKASTKNAFSRCIYRIYAGNEIYIGLTYDTKQRFSSHRKKTTQVIDLIERHGIENVKFEQLTEYMNQELAQIAEKEHIEYYRNNGWIILNRSKAGALGSSTLKWTPERLKEDALKYKTSSEWRKMSPSAYAAAHKKGLLDECYAHMTMHQKPNGYWTLERLKEDALKYKTRREWRENSSGCSNAYNQGIIDECCAHMELQRKPNGYWTLERLKEDALKYKTRSDWQKNSSAAYSSANRKGFLDECCAHMTKNARCKRK
ncbi:hypothetical protein phiGrn1_0289 [Vibrio phage phi-Grn1]|uniref:GIY-YIG domain-containing protein n=1 Tax=Vibrio phage phi-Grn1 TaxID=1747713 RepID=A0A126HGL6_9CAUD|nr:hypothetical protein phiGrn1_0289 [Vibrio phage phi-Grn1]